jgi:hypothetical protein
MSVPSGQAFDVDLFVRGIADPPEWQAVLVTVESNWECKLRDQILTTRREGGIIAVIADERGSV